MAIIFRKEKSNNKLLRKEIDLLIAAALLTASLFTGYSAYFGESDQLDSNTKDSIAEVDSLTNGGRIKRKKFIHWEKLLQQQSLSESDLVITNPSSTATIIFKDGTTINLQENAVIRVVSSKDGSGINVESGNVTLSTNNRIPDTAPPKPFFIQSGETKIEIDEKAELAIGSSDGKLKNVNVLGGKAKVLTDNKEIDLDQNVALVSKGDEKGFNIEKVTLKILLPKQHDKIITAEKDLVLFSWSSTSKEKESLLEISKDSAFSQIVASKKTKKNSLKLKINDGSFYWRVMQKENSENKYSRIGFFRNIRLAPPKIIGPMHDATFTFNPLSDVPEVFFKWQSEIEGSVEFEVTGKSKFSKTTNEGYHVLVKPENGTYQWRVRQHTPKGKKSKWSTKRTFTISNLSAKPRALTPAQGFKANLSSDKPYVNFTWKTDVQVEATISITKTTNLGTTVVNETTRDSQYLWQPKAPGEYLWRISTEGASSKVKARKITVNFPEPTGLTTGRGKKIVIATPEDTVQLLWSGSDFYERYRVEISDNPKMKNSVLSSEFFNEKFEYKDLKEGKIYWRVIGMFEGGGKINSNINNFEIELPPALPPPEVEPEATFEGGWISPPPQQNYMDRFLSLFVATAHAEESASKVSQLSKTEIKLNWPQVNGAVLYVLQVSNDKSFKSFVVNERTKINRYATAEIPPGLYYWRVAAVDAWKRVGPFSKIGKISVRNLMSEFLGKKIIISTPENGYRFVSGEDSEPLSLNWQPVKGADQYRLTIISREDNDKGTKEIILKENTYTTAREIYQDVAEISWFVTPIRKSVSGERSTTHKVYIRPKLKILEPPEEFVRHKIATQFSWESLPGVEKYILTIKDSKGSTVNSTETKDHSFVLEPSSDLTNGEIYSWWVIPIYKEAEGEKSNQRKFIQLNPPTLESPPNNHRWDTNVAEDISLRWKGEGTHIKYVLEIDDSNDFDDLKTFDLGPSISHKVHKDQVGESFHWRLRSTVDNYVGQPSDSREIGKIDHSRTISYDLSIHSMFGSQTQQVFDNGEISYKKTGSQLSGSGVQSRVYWRDKYIVLLGGQFVSSKLNENFTWQDNQITAGLGMKFRPGNSSQINVSGISEAHTVHFVNSPDIRVMSMLPKDIRMNGGKVIGRYEFTDTFDGVYGLKSTFGPTDNDSSRGLLMGVSYKALKSWIFLLTFVTTPLRIPVIHLRKSSVTTPSKFPCNMSLPAFFYNKL